jgi:hypothetical protein
MFRYIASQESLASLTRPCLELEASPKLKVLAASVEVIRRPSPHPSKARMSLCRLRPPPNTTSNPNPNRTVASGS